MTRTNKILLAVVAAAAVICAFYFLALAPKREEIARLDTEVAAKQAEVEQAQQTLATYELARASYKANYAKLVRLGKAVPAEDDVRSLLVQLESAADRSGVDFEKIELGTGLAGASGGAPADAKSSDETAPAPGSVPVAGGALSAMPFSFTFTGSYFDLSTFLARLERFVTVQNRRIDATGRLLRLESVQIAPSAAGFPEMKAEINAATYMVPPVTGVPSAQGQEGEQAPEENGDPYFKPPTTAATTGAAR
jgi:Tfp pilus assembly protein PilO